MRRPFDSISEGSQLMTEWSAASQRHMNVNSQKCIRSLAGAQVRNIIGYRSSLAQTVTTKFKASLLATSHQGNRRRRK